MELDPQNWGCPRFPHLLKQTSNNTKYNDCTLNAPIAHTTSPTVTGSSVIAVKYSNGIIMAADCLASYGSLARFRDVQRINELNKHCLLGTSGDIADCQSLLKELNEYTGEEMNEKLNPRHLFNYLQQLHYKRRCDMNPLWNSHVIAGVSRNNNHLFLGVVDLKGTSYEADAVATGFGNYLAIPMLRKADPINMSEEEAVDLVVKCMKVLYARDARALDKIQLAKVTTSGCEIGQPIKISIDWSIA